MDKKLCGAGGFAMALVLIGGSFCWSWAADSPLPARGGKVAPTAAAAQRGGPAALATGDPSFEDAPVPLAPAHPRSEAQRDRLEALALFASGRAHEQRDEDTKALRCYERAAQFDPRSSAIIRAILPVAIRLGRGAETRNAEAVRYVAKLTDFEESDIPFLLELRDYLVREEDWSTAIALYEKAVASRKRSKATAGDAILRMELARLYCLKEQYKQAAEMFAWVCRALDHPADFNIGDDARNALLMGQPGQTYQLMGECFLAAGRLTDAAAAFHKAEGLSADKAMRQFNAARLDARRGKPAAALATLESCLPQLSSLGAEPYEALADALKQLGKKDEVLGRLEKLRAAEPGNAPLGYFLAGQYAAAGKIDQAQSLYWQLLKTKPSLSGYRQLIDLARKHQRVETLLDALGEVADEDGMLTLGLEGREIAGDAALMRGLVERARKRVQGGPRKVDPATCFVVALLALEAKQYDTAGEFFRAALAAKPKRPDKVFAAWGIGCLAGDRPAEAVKVFQRAIAEKAASADNPVFDFYLAGALAMAGRDEEALAAARRAAKKKKDSAEYWSRPAWVLYRAKRYDEAHKAYTQLIDDFDVDHASEETREVLHEARLSLSNLAVLQNDIPAAEEWLAQVLDEFPDDTGAMNDLGYLWADENKRLGRAEEMIRAAVAAEPDNAAYRDSLGWVLFRLGKYPQAVAELKQAAADKTVDGTVWEHLGDAYARLNQGPDARKAWGQAAAAFRKEREMEKAKAVEEKIGKRIEQKIEHKTGER